MIARPALFLDRDGVVNIDHGYVYSQENFHFVDGIFDLVANAHKLGYLVVIVTNQAGIGRGLYTPEDFHALMSWVTSRFQDGGGDIDAIYFCPHHPEHGLGKYRQVCCCRKPAPGMFLQAQKDHGIDMERSILIGDKPSDIIAGRAAGVRTLIGFTGIDNVYQGAIHVSRLSYALYYLQSK